MRQALGYAFDFEWSNQNALLRPVHAHAQLLRQLRAGGERRCRSAAELALLEPFRGKLPDEVFTTEYQPPATDGSGNMRDNLRKAAELLKAAGWTIDPKTQEARQRAGPAVRVRDPARSSRPSSASSLPFVKNLERLGVDGARAHGRHRAVPEAPRRLRLRHDHRQLAAVALARQRAARLLGLSATPTSRAAATSIGIKDPVVDALVEQIDRGARPREPGRAHARARPRAAVGLLRRSRNWHIAVRPRRLLGQVRPARRSSRRRACRSTPGGSIRPRRRRSQATTKSTQDAGTEPSRAPIGELALRATRARWLAYILRRLLLMIPTLFGIMVLNFVIVQAAPGGPVEQMIAQLQGTGVSATARFSGGGGEVGGGGARGRQHGGAASKYRGAQGLDPQLIKRARAAVRLRQAGARALPADDAAATCASTSARASSAAAR